MDLNRDIQHWREALTHKKPAQLAAHEYGNRDDLLRRDSEHRDVHTMRKWEASVLLIEGKASGLTVHQELRRLHFDENWSVQLVNPKGDKVTRALAAQPTFAQGLVYAPVKDWSQMVIDEMEVFPKGRYDDLTDSSTMAISFLRSSGILQTDGEAMAAEESTVRHRPRRLRPLYPC